LYEELYGGLCDKVLSSLQVLDGVNRKKYSVHRLFQNFDVDRSGALDTARFDEGILSLSLPYSRLYE
jgi:hypothetical protein